MLGLDGILKIELTRAKRQIGFSPLTKENIAVRGTVLSFFSTSHIVLHGHKRSRLLLRHSDRTKTLKRNQQILNSMKSKPTSSSRQTNWKLSIKQKEGKCKETANQIRGLALKKRRQLHFSICDQTNPGTAPTPNTK